jgi:hypothetical protein
MAMSKQRYAVLIETAKGRVPAKFTVPATASAVEVAMRLRAKGWEPYRLCFDPESSSWIASVIDWKRAA